METILRRNKERVFREKLIIALASNSALIVGEMTNGFGLTEIHLQSSAQMIIQQADIIIKELNKERHG